MAELALALAVGGSKALAAYKKSKAHDAQAVEYRHAKNRRMGAATRDAAEGERKKEFMHSRALVLSAASGAGVDDPSIVNALGDLNAEGEYNIMAMLWQGVNDAEGLIARSKLEERAADDAMTAGMVDAVVSGFSTYMKAGGTFGKDKLGGSSEMYAETERPEGFEKSRWGF